jgi:hypothetical protein
LHGYRSARDTGTHLDQPLILAPDELQLPICWFGFTDGEMG